VSVNLNPQAALIASINPTSLTVNGMGTLSTSGGSGTGPVTYAVASGTCTVNGSTLTGTGAGNCSVTATKAADTQYAATTSNPISVTVAGPPAVRNVRALPGAGFIKVAFDVVTTASSASMVRVQTAVLYTATCTSTDGGVTASVTGPQSPLDVFGTTAGKSYTCTVTGTDGSGSSTSDPSNPVTPAPAPPPVNPIPTLGEWAQIIMMLMMIVTAGVYGRRRA
jgi:hypothetical protein